LILTLFGLLLSTLYGIALYFWRGSSNRQPALYLGPSQTSRFPQRNPMPFINILFGVILSTLYGAAFHFWRGGSTRRLALYLGLSWAGFWAGHYLGQLMGWSFAQVGPLYVGMATLGSLAALFTGYGFFYFREMREG
jgi:hypothetical protein